MMTDPQNDTVAVWWQVAKHLDDTQLSLAAAIAFNVDDPQLMQALFERLREGQALLLEIFRSKGLVPTEQPASNGHLPEQPMNGHTEQSANGHAEQAANGQADKSPAPDPTDQADSKEISSEEISSSLPVVVVPPEEATDAEVPSA